MATNTSADRAIITPARYVAILTVELHSATANMYSAAEAVLRDAERLKERAEGTGGLNGLGELQGRPSQAESALGRVLGRVQALEKQLDLALRMELDWYESDWELFTSYARRTPRALRLARDAGLEVE